MHPAPARCPICQSELTVIRLQCSSCDTSIHGNFTPGRFSNLTAEQLDFAFTFIRCEGRINRMEQELGVSYPTIRNRLLEVIRALEYAPGRDDTMQIDQERRNNILEDLSAGKINADQATRLLQGSEE